MLAGDLVTLRPRTAADADPLYELTSELSSWEERGPQTPKPLTREAFDARFAERQAERDGGTTFAIEADGAFAGQCSLFDVDHLARTAEVGIELLPAFRGRGLGTDALRVLVEFAFTRQNLRRVHLRCLADNAAAVASYRKVGFVEEGRLRESAWVRGRYTDEVLMGLLRSER